MALGYDKPLHILAFDHRGSFQKKFFGVTGEPNEEETARISDAKRVIYEGARRALDEGVEAEAAGVLVDEQFGADIARDAKTAGFRLAMPVEKSGQEEFDFQYDEDFGAHIESLDPSFSKVLVRYNTEADQAMNERQAARLKRLGDWLHEHGRLFLFELLVPPTPEQIAAVAVEEDVDVVGLSILSGSHLDLVPQVVRLVRAGGVDAPIVAGGIIPEEDRQPLLDAGVAAVYTPKDFELVRIMRDIVDLATAPRER